MKSGELVSIRETYGKHLVELGKRYSNIRVLDADLSSSTCGNIFKEAFPDRHYNFGIAEANMVGYAAGMAAKGGRVFANTFAIFMTGRAYDQIYNSVGRSKLPVVLVGTHGGFVGEDGPSHHGLMDIALMRTVPNMRIVEPVDANEVVEVLEEIVNYQDGPVYMRLRRDNAMTLDREEKFQLGKGQILKRTPNSHGIAIVASGAPVYEALKATEDMPYVTVINMSSVKPLDEGLIGCLDVGHDTVIVIQEHYKEGGLGEAIAPLLVGSKVKKFRNFCVSNETDPANLPQYPPSASAKELRKRYKLDARGIRERIDKILRNED